MSEKIVVVTGSDVAAGVGLPTLGKVTSSLLNNGEYSKILSHDYGNYLPELWQFARDLAMEAAHIEPGEFHKTLAVKGWDVITQNIGNLQKRAGSTDVVEIYGNLFSMRCLRCNHEEEFSYEKYKNLYEGEVPLCIKCGKERTRPDIVLPQEGMKHRKQAEKLLREATTIIYVGVKEDSGLITEWYHKVPLSILVSEEPWGNFDKVFEMSPNAWAIEGMPR